MTHSTESSNLLQPEIQLKDLTLSYVSWYLITGIMTLQIGFKSNEYSPKTNLASEAGNKCKFI